MQNIERSHPSHPNSASMNLKKKTMEKRKNRQKTKKSMHKREQAYKPADVEKFPNILM